MPKIITNKIKHTALAILLGSTLVSCGGTQTDVAFYGYPDPSGYSVAESPVIGQSFEPVKVASSPEILDKQPYILSSVETEPLIAQQLPTKTISAFSATDKVQNVYVAAGVQSPEKLNAIAPASSGKKVSTIPPHPVTMLSKNSKQPKCEAGATLARDSNNIPTCFKPAPDAQQACTDSSQCSSSHCLVDDGSTVMKGQCFSLIPFTGCGSVLVDGKIKNICS